MTDSFDYLSSSAQTEDDLQLYLKEIREYPRLTPEEELEIAKRCAAGDEDAIRQMVNANLRLVVYVARTYAGRGVSLLDLIQEGSIGLLAAAQKFDYSMNCRFSTYATKWIRHGITRCLLNDTGLIRIPAHTAEKMQKIDSVKKELLAEQGTAPSISEIAHRVNLPDAKVEALMGLRTDVISLDIPAGEPDGIALSDLIEGIHGLQPQEAIVRQELEKTISSMLELLTDRQQQILRLHFGMEDGVEHSLEDIGKRMGISKERVRQIEHQAMNKLQSLGKSMGLEDFLE